MSSGVRSLDDGAWSAVLLVLGAGVAFAAATSRHLPGPKREQVLLKAAAVTAVVLLAAGLVGALRAAETVRSHPQIVQGPSRRPRSLNNRWDRWKEAWEGSEGQPLGGTGAGVVRARRRQFRKNDVDVTEVQSPPLQFASELGLVGLSAPPPASGARCSRRGGRRRWDGNERAAVPALAVALPTFLVHGALDYDWDFVAAALHHRRAPRDRENASPREAGVRVGRRRRARRVGGPVLDRGPARGGCRVDDAFAQLERGDVEVVARTAKSAHPPNPLSIAPLEAGRRQKRHRETPQGP